eukprot:scaffold101133_cov51-Attheya_sp.AAC.3
MLLRCQSARREKTSFYEYVLWHNGEARQRRCMRTVGDCIIEHIDDKTPGTHPHSRSIQSGQEGY